MFRRLGGEPIPFWLQGTVGERRFRIHRIHTSGTAGPILEGVIEPCPGGSLIRLATVLEPTVLALLVASLGLSIHLAVTLHTFNGTYLGFLLPLVLPVGYFTSSRLHVRSLTRDLRGLFDSPEAPDAAEV